MSNVTKKLSNELKNLISAPINSILRALDIPSKPLWVVLMLTDMCNSRCVHCNIWRNKPSGKHLTPEEIEKIFSDKLFKDVRYILCTGGETTIRQDLEEIFLRLHKVLPRATLQLSTNALLPERVIGFADTVLKNGIELDVGVSLDGIGEFHDNIRGVKGNFEKADFLLKKLVELRQKYPHNLNIAAGIVISDLTVNSVYQVREYAKKLNIGLVEAWYNTSSFYGNFVEKDKNIIKDKIIQIVKSQPSSIIQEKWISWLKGNPIKFPCFGMSTFCVIKSNGDLVPCLNKWEASAGNLRDHSPSEAWYSDQAKKVRKIVSSCKGCLNAWGAGWSFQSSYYPVLYFYLRHPKVLLKELQKII